MQTYFCRTKTDKYSSPNSLLNVVSFRYHLLMKPISILILDDVPYVRQLIANEVSVLQGIAQIYEAGDAAAAVIIISTHRAGDHHSGYQCAGWDIRKCTLQQWDRCAACGENLAAPTQK